jgi:acyl-CoA reductase-like NAD-dependent aldehyde dehydrogenase
MASAAGGVKRVTLELGGNDAAIVLDDMPAKLAAERSIRAPWSMPGRSAWRSSAPMCTKPSMTNSSGKITRLAQDAVVDEGTRQGVTIGPVQNKMQFEKVSALLADARERGTVLAGGAPLDRPGYFIAPTIVADLDDDAPLVREEQFGPVLPVLKFPTWTT